MDAPFVSVIIAAGRPDLTETVQSLRGQDYPAERFETLVVSERSDLTVPSLENLRVLPSASSNPAVKRNLGAAEARGEILAFIDDDAVAPPFWLTSGVRLLAGRPECAGAGGPNLPPPGAPFAERLTDAILNLPLIGSGSGSYRRTSGVTVARAGDLHLVNLFVRKTMYQECGGLNESVGYGGEDTEFIHWVETTTGKRFLFSGDLFVHHYRRPFGTAYIRQRFMLRANNGRLFAARPSIYGRSMAFWGLLTGPVAFLAALVVAPAAAVAVMGLYLFAVMGVCVWARPAMAMYLPLVVVVHHATYAGGLYWGLISAVSGRERIRAIRARKRIE